MQHRQGKRQLGKAVDDLAHDIRAFVPKEQARQHLQLEIGAQLDAAELAGDGFGDETGVTRQVLKSVLQVEVTHQLDDTGLHGLRRGVIGAVGWQRFGLVVFDVLGADRRPYKNKLVLKIAAVQYFGGDRVEKALCQFGLVMVNQQADVMQLHLVPHVHRQRARLELFA